MTGRDVNAAYTPAAMANAYERDDVVCIGDPFGPERVTQGRPAVAFGIGCQAYLDRALISPLLFQPQLVSKHPRF